MINLIYKHIFRGQSFTLLLFFCLRDFLQWQVVTGMEAEQIIESLANYIWFLRVPNVSVFHIWF